jgi:hypothetical protein
MRFYLVMLLSLFVTPAFAGIPYAPTASLTVDTEEAAYVGLIWSLSGGLSQTPDLSAGFQSVDIESDGDIDSGYDINLRFALNGLSLLPEIYSMRASSLFGDDEAIGNIGIGFTSGGSWLATVGLQGDYGRLGMDAAANGLTFTGELLTLELPDKPKAELKCIRNGVEYPNDEDPYNGDCIVP